MTTNLTPRVPTGRRPTPAEEHGSPTPGERLAYVVRRFEVSVPVLIPEDVSGADAVARAMATPGVYGAIRQMVENGEYDDVSEAVVDGAGELLWDPTPAPTPATAIRDVVGAIHDAMRMIEAGRVIGGAPGRTRLDEAHRILGRALLDVGAARLVIDPNAGQ